MGTTLIFVFLALLCVVAGGVVISRRRAVFRMDEDDDFSPDAVEAAATAPEVAGGGLGARVRALFGSGVSETTWDGLRTR